MRQKKLQLYDLHLNYNSVLQVHQTPYSGMIAAMKPEAKQAPSGVSSIEIGPEHEGQRIDNFLVTALKGVPKSHVYRILRKGEVRVNKGRVPPSYRLKAGDVVRVPPIRVAAPEAPPMVGKGTLERLQQAIIYEDRGLLIIDKPAGMAVHGGSGVSYGVIEGLRALRPEATLELVHRLDRDTSGCLIIAKRRSALRTLHELLRDGKVEKRYLALVRGRLEKQWVDAPLRKNVLSSGERVVKVAADGKPAQTEFTPVERFENATLVDVRLLTGRTHQIRVHAAYLGHGLAGDEKYGDADFNKRMRDEAGLKRLFLHAASLSFLAPGSTQRVSINAPLPAELQEVLNRLKLRHD